MTYKKEVRYRKNAHGVYVVYAFGERKTFQNSRAAKRYYKYCKSQLNNAA